MRRAASRFLCSALLAAAGPLSAQGGVPMGAEFRVNTVTSGYQGFPGVASDASGNFVVVWQGVAGGGSGYDIFGQRYASSGAPQGAEFLVNTYTTTLQTKPSVASNPSGTFVVVWTGGSSSGPSPDGSSYGVFGQRFTSTGAPAGAEFQVNTYTTDRQERARVASDAAGNFVVVWQSYRQDGIGSYAAFNYGVFGQRYASSGAALGTEFRVNTYTTGSQRFPSLAADSSGNFIVVWEGSTQAPDGSGYGVFGQRYASSGAALGAEFLVNTYTTDPQRLPSVVSDTAGNFVVVWTSGPASGPSQDGSKFGVFGQRFSSTGAPAGVEFRVNTTTTDGQELSRVASDSSGNFVVVWSSFLQDGYGYGAFGQRYASSGAPLGPEFRVNTYTTNNQIPSVASDAAGNFVVVWSSGQSAFAVGQDGSSYGVFGQRFGTIVPVELTRFTAE